jgi:hypothetical protein
VDDDEDDDEDDALSGELPEAIMKAEKIRMVLMELRTMFTKEGKPVTVASLVEWCVAHAGTVPALQRMGDDVRGRAERAARLLVEGAAE